MIHHFEIPINAFLCKPIAFYFGIRHLINYAIWLYFNRMILNLTSLTWVRFKGLIILIGSFYFHFSLPTLFVDSGYFFIFYLVSNLSGDSKFPYATNLFILSLSFKKGTNLKLSAFLLPSTLSVSKVYINYICARLPWPTVL